VKVAIIGANGQLGTDAAQAFADSGDIVFPIAHGDIEISSIDSVMVVLRELKPDLIVNTAAMHHVERCQLDPKRALEVNALGPHNLATISRELAASLMHISTDYVFDGAKGAPYLESDVPQPLNTYGITKLAGEQFVHTIAERHFIVRTSALYGRSPCRGKGGLNFVDLMLKLGRERGKVRVVDSEEVTPTSTAELARQMVLISHSGSFGVFHATAKGSCTWYDFAREIFSIGGLAVNVERADPGEFPSKVPRPRYSVLENAALRACGMDCFRPWQEGLVEYLDVAGVSRSARQSRYPIGSF
jgi:dTDP-4-dehydrorhamnose reductase